TPNTLTVPLGAMVTWTNKDDVPHTVVSTKKRFASPALDTDQRFSFRFTARGTYPYYCSVHPMMTGTVVVKCRRRTHLRHPIPGGPHCTLEHPIRWSRPFGKRSKRYCYCSRRTRPVTRNTAQIYV